MKKFSEKIIDLTPQTHKHLLPSEYIEFISTQKEQVKSSRFKIPTLGSDDFGSFEVELNNPFFEMANK